MLFSFIVPYRNRETVRVKNCLQSILNQTFKDFEVIFTDYGSDLPRQQEIEMLCKQLGQVDYTYYDTRYQFWSRAHAINLGIRKAKGDYLIIVDIDLIYSPYFAEELKNMVSEKSFIQYQCYYLPQEFTNYDSLDFKKQYSFNTSTTHIGGGLIIIPRKSMLAIGGFDEYFKVWGVEDMEMLSRLKQENLENKILSISHVKNFHQWHAPASHVGLMPHLWLSAMEKYAKQKLPSPLPYLSQEFVGKRSSLSIIQTIENQPNKYFYFEYPTLQAYSKFAQAFYTLQSGDYLIVNQKFEAIKASEKSRLAGIFSRVNQLFGKINISYRITELQTFETEMMNFTNVRDFIFYFIADNQAFISDYAFDVIYPSQIKCVLFKK